MDFSMARMHEMNEGISASERERERYREKEGVK